MVSLSVGFIFFFIKILESGGKKQSVYLWMWVVRKIQPIVPQKHPI